MLWNLLVLNTARRRTFLVLLLAPDFGTLNSANFKKCRIKICQRRHRAAVERLWQQMGCSTLQPEAWHCRIFGKLASMKKLLAVLIAGSFAAGAFAQTATPAQPATPAAAAAAPTVKHMKAQPAQKHHMQHSTKKMHKPA
ncbi:hypothetical protein [Comamonas testosteroni]